MTRAARRKAGGEKVVLRLRGYAAVRDAVESGAALGWRRAHKHTDVPTGEFAAETIARAVMEVLEDVVDWERTG